MALESLNRYIKKEKLKDNGNIRLEKLLNVLEEVVDDKMWKRIILLKRPNRNTYQGRAVVLAHKKAELMKGCVKEEGFGHFSVKSSKSDKYYNVHYKESCVNINCREMFCAACKVCFHKYRCECVEYLVKSITCKHVHVVALYERERLKLVSGIQEVSCQKETNNNEISEFLEQKAATLTNYPEKIDVAQRRNLVMEGAFNYINQMFNLDDNAFQGLLKLSCS